MYGNLEMARKFGHRETFQSTAANTPLQLVDDLAATWGLRRGDLNIVSYASISSWKRRDLTRILPESILKRFILRLFLAVVPQQRRLDPGAGL